jgi:hypothetical protein
MASLTATGHEDQTAYSSIVERLIRTSEAYILFYSVTSRSTFAYLKDRHEMILGVRSKCAKRGLLPLIVVGCTSGLAMDENAREVEAAEGEMFAKAIGALFLEIDAADELQVLSVFSALMRFWKATRLPESVYSNPRDRIPADQLEDEKEVESTMVERILVALMNILVPPSRRKPAPRRRRKQKGQWWIDYPDSDSD